MNLRHKKHNKATRLGVTQFNPEMPHTRVTFWYVLTILFSVPAAVASVGVISFYLLFMIISPFVPFLSYFFIVYAFGGLLIHLVPLPALAMSFIGFLMSFKPDPRSKQLRKVGLTSLVLSFAYIAATYTSLGFYTYTVLATLLLVWLAVYKKVAILQLILLTLGLITLYIAILFVASSPSSPEFVKDFFLFGKLAN